MTDEKEDAVPSSYDPALPDNYLQLLVDLINGTEMEFPITLFVGGTVVSGQLVSGHRYFEQGLGSALKEYFTGMSDDAEVTRAIENLTSAKELYTNKDLKPTLPPAFIHLRGARVFTPGQEPTPRGGSWWRGRLSRVDAFHFGSLATKDSS